MSALFSAALELQAYIPVGWAFVLALGFCGLFVALSVLFGPSRSSPEKAQPFECGSEPIGSPRARYSVKFYQVAILFLVFDIESAFMYPWAIKFRELSGLVRDSAGQLTAPLSLFGFVEMLVFVAVLVVALAYVWRKKAIGWD
jgi:NADH-quinone oxidoreductase subunit A